MPHAIMVDSPGGGIFDFLHHFQHLVDTGQSLIIAGRVCASACVLFSTMPADRVCLKDTVTLRVHAAGAPGRKSEVGTARVLMLYPQHLRDWIKDQGGLPDDPARFLEMKYPETAKHFRICGR